MKTETLTYQEIRTRVNLASHPAVAAIKDRAVQIMIRKNTIPYARILEPLNILNRTMEEMEMAGRYMGQGQLSHRLAGKILTEAVATVSKFLENATEEKRAEIQEEISLLQSALEKITAEKTALQEKEEVKTYFIKETALPADANGEVFQALGWMIEIPESE